MVKTAMRMSGFKHIVVADFNNIPLANSVSATPHFKLREFQNRQGMAMVHPAVVDANEQVRAALWRYYGTEVALIVTDGIRTQADNEALAWLLGWTDEGGAVSRNSKHLSKYGGIAVDLKARKLTGGRVSQRVLGDMCRRFFHYVKADYGDGHVHADLRRLIT